MDTDAPTPEEPDYRYTLANERTFLAWIRTSVTVLAGAVAFAQLGWDLGPHWLRLAVALVLAALAVTAALSGLWRWRGVEIAMRTGGPLPPARAPWLIGLVLAVIAMVIAVVIAIDVPK